MPDYSKYRQMVSHRVTFEYDTGAKVVGYLARCFPASGPVELVHVTRAQVLGRDGAVLEAHEQMSLVPNALVNIRVAEGPRGRDV